MARKVATKEEREAKAAAAPKKVAKPRVKKVKPSLDGGELVTYEVEAPVKKGLSKTFKKLMKKNNCTTPEEYRKIRNPKLKKLRKGITPKSVKK